MFHRLQTVYASYPSRFWLLAACHLLQRTGASFLWPFLSLIVAEQTGAPLERITALYSVQAVASLIGTSVISSLMDRYGRKRLMLAGLVGVSAVTLLLSQANTLEAWLVLIPLYGTLVPVFIIGANAMVADIVPQEQRTDAYAILRMGANLGISLGPTIGGALIARSHGFAYAGFIGLHLALLIPVGLLISETLRLRTSEEQTARLGYGAILRDRPFVVFSAVFLLIELCTTMIFNLLAVYTKQQFGIQENQVGAIVGLNALMVVCFQVFITRQTRRWPPYLMLALGAVFYALGTSSYAIATQFEHFLAGMVIITLGEMIAMPTATALVAHMAPPDMRARYMGIYSVMYTVAAGIGPLIGGQAALRFGPSAIWWSAAVMAGAGALGFVALHQRTRAQQMAAEQISAPT